MSVAIARPFVAALLLSLASAISLGIARFSYAMLLPPMRNDLDWTYLIAGSMNTANAMGYFAGALATPLLMRMLSPERIVGIGAAATAVFMLLSGAFTEVNFLLAQRFFTGIASAVIFVAGGILAARLAAMHPSRGALLLALFYGGPGIGIIASAWIVPSALSIATALDANHAWQSAWIALGLLCVALAAAMTPVLSGISAPTASGQQGGDFRLRDFRFGLAAYFLFGVGYIGYMTFIIALLQDQGTDAFTRVVFYTVLGVAVLCSPRLWTRLFERYRGGESMAILSALLAGATVMPVLSPSLPVVLLSGTLFGATFLCVVASTTVMVRHNLPPHAWTAGISAFTIMFAIGQIVGPTLTGWISDGGGLESAFLFSAAALFIGAVLAMRQKPLG